MAGNYFDQFDEQAPAGGNYFDQFDVVDQGGPRSLMSRKLDEIDPNGKGRRSDRRDYMATDEYKLERGRASLDMRARTSPLFGPAYRALEGIKVAEQQRGKPFLPQLAPEDRPRTLIPSPIEALFGGEMPDAERGQKMIRGILGSPLEGATFSFDDEILGGAVGLFDKEAGKRMAENRRAEQYASRTDTPATNLAGNIAGGVATPMNRPLMALAGIKNTAAAAKPVLQSVREGARVGALGGALFGFGAGEGGAGERLDEAATGALYGATGGAVLGGALGALSNKVSAGEFFVGKGRTLDTAALGLDVPSSAKSALFQILRSGGYSSDDIDRGIVNAVGRIQRAADAGERIPLFATALQDEFPAAQQNIQDVFQQLMTAPPRQGTTGRILTDALDEQYGSQGSYLEGVAQQKLGTSTIADEQARLAAERGAIGEVRDRAIKFSATDARGRGLQKQMRDWWGQLSDDPEVASNMRAAARELGYPRTAAMTEIEAAMADNPALLLQKFGEISGAQIRSPRGASPVLERARVESEALFDELSRYGREADNFAFAKRAEGETGPYKQQQSRFRQNYSQEETITDARGRFAQVRDPVKADEFVGWYNSLPEGEQQLVKTVIRQDIEKMLRGGNIDQDGAYLTNLKKVGVNDVLKKLFGKEGEDITRAISTLVDEQKALTGLDPRKGLQERVVRGGAADRARNLYTTSPLARLGDKIPPASQLADLALMGQGQLPYVTIARQALKAFRPRARTREGLAQILAMRQAPALPPPTGKLSRMPPTGLGGAPAAQSAPQGAQGGAGTALPPPAAPNAPAPIRQSQRSAWSPVQVSEPPPVVPRGDSRMQQQANRLAQKAHDLRQRAADAEARATDARTLRQVQEEAAKAENAARAMERLALNEEAVTKAVRAAQRKAGKAEQARLKAQGREDRALAAREAAAKLEREQAEQGLDTRLDIERRTKAAAKDEAAAMKDRALADRIKQGTEDRVDTYTNAQKIDIAQRNAEADVDPIRTWEETGHLALNIDGKPIVGLDHKASSADDLLRQLQRVEDDVLGPNRNRPEKWSMLTLQLEKGIGLNKLKEEIRKGLVPGWRTPQERATYEAGRTMAKGAAGVAGVTALGIGAFETGKALDRRAKAARVKAIVENPETVKVIQRALKAARQYDGRADGKLDGDVQIAIAQFQGSNGLGKSSDPGALDYETLVKLEEYLVFEGKTKLADEVRSLRLNKQREKAKEN